MRSILSNILALGLVAGIIGFAVYFFAFGQTFEGEIEMSAENDETGVIGLVTFQSRFQNRRFLTHSMFLDLAHDTPTTYRGDIIDAQDAIERFANTKWKRVSDTARKNPVGAMWSASTSNLLVLHLKKCF